MGEEKWAEYQKERQRKKHKVWYQKNTDKVKADNKKRSGYVTGWRIRAKQKLIAYKGGKCIKCGYNKDVPSAYDFHHRDAKSKEFGISRYQILNFEKILKEVDKCDLVCKNCHAEIHDIDRKEKRDEAIRKYNEWIEGRKISIDIECKNCHIIFRQKRPSQKYCCGSCHDMFYRKVKDRPTKAELSDMIGSIPMIAIGKKYGVSDNAIRKWAKQYGLI